MAAEAKSEFSIHPEVEALREEVVRNRRHFHENPELSFQEVETAKYVASCLKSYGIEVTEGVGRTGVVGVLRGQSDSPCIALRADMDALPITETTGLPFSSRNEGVMHACGHDGHMAELLCAAKVMAGMRDRIKGSVKFLFQPAEEGLGGAREMIKDGCLDGVDAVYGCHLWTYDDVGVVGVQSGPVMAASDRFEITVRGAGGHGAAPQGTVDAVVAASQLVVALQSVVARNVNPLQNAVVTVGQINGGYNYNIIADEVTLVGTVRSFDREVQALVVRRINEIAQHTAAAFGGEAHVNYQYGYPPTVNFEERCVEHVAEAGRRVVPSALVRPPYRSMGAEDFSYFLHERPGAFFFVGASPTAPGEGRVPHHKSIFTIDEESMMVAASVFVHLVDTLLVAPENPAEDFRNLTTTWDKPPAPPQPGKATLPVLCACSDALHESFRG